MTAYDFHIHSSLSPCGNDDMTPNNIINMASLAELSVIAVSDHNTVGNVRAVSTAGKKAGIEVIPAMEVETQEEVHILTLFPDISAAEEAAKDIYKHLPPIKNNPDIFGHQFFMDENDNVTGEEEKMLITSCGISVNYLFGLVRETGGIFIPAHVDRHSYSVLTNLGFIPDDLDIRFIEISKKTLDIDSYLESRSDLKKYEILRSSDAHRLEDMITEPCFLNSSIKELFDKR